MARKPGFVEGDHSSRTAVTDGLKQPTWEFEGGHPSRFGLAPDGFTMPQALPSAR